MKITRFLSASIWTVIFFSSGDGVAGYDPMFPSTNPTWSDVNDAERYAFEHGHRSVELMSADNSWQCIEEMSKARRARDDALQMRIDIEARERREQQERQDLWRQLQEDGWNNNIGNNFDDRKGAVIQNNGTIVDSCRKGGMIGRRTGTPNLSAPLGTCMFCGARLLGKRRCCGKCRQDFDYRK